MCANHCGKMLEFCHRKPVILPFKKLTDRIPLYVLLEEPMPVKQSFCPLKNV